MNIVSFLRLAFIFIEPVSVADPHRRDDGVDQSQLRTPAGKAWIAPSSIAGALREHLDKAGLAEKFMGFAKNTDELTPSAIRILQTVLTNDEIGTRTQTAIDRFRSAAKDKTMRNSERLLQGATLTVDLQLDGRLSDDLKQLLGNWHPVLGGAKATGQGSTELKSWHYGTLDLTSEQDLKIWLSKGGPALVEAVATIPGDIELPQAADAVLDLRFVAKDGLMVNPVKPDSKERPNHCCAAEIAGSSIKGIFRSRAEFIAGSIEQSISAKQPVVYENLIDSLFGKTDRLGCIGFPAIPLVGGHSEIRTHVAIDRVTGGYADQKLFTEEIRMAATFTLRIVEIKDLPSWATSLLWAIVADLDHGLIGIGSRTSRGHGTVQLLSGEDRSRAANIDLSLLEDALISELQATEGQEEHATR